MDTIVLFESLPQHEQDIVSEYLYQHELQKITLGHSKLTTSHNSEMNLITHKLQNVALLKSDHEFEIYDLFRQRMSKKTTLSEKEAFILNCIVSGKTGILKSDYFDEIVEMCMAGQVNLI